MKNLYIADLHIHSRYSRATSRDCIPEMLEFTAARKGIGVLGSGDFTHPAWREELKEKLEKNEEGLYVLKKEYQKDTGRKERPKFIISGEISSIYKKNGKVRKVHSLILLPDLEAAQKLAFKLETIGNLHSDGRPILGLDCRDLVEITLSVCPDAIYIPAHIWTPHFSLFGAFSGFDTIEECYEDMTPYIHALETGLSSDPAMNWQLSALDPYFLISNSDAHSPAKLGREGNLLEGECSYLALKEALTTGKGLLGTIEFFPEEGKYHYDGHRNCGVCLSPKEAEKFSGKCPVCGRKLTIGVSHRICQLADRPEGIIPKNNRPYESLVPLQEVIASCLDCGIESTKAERMYETMLQQLGTEFEILRQLPKEEIASKVGGRIAEGIRRLREGKVFRTPGYDGEYGSIEFFSPEEKAEMEGQLCLFSGIGQKEPSQLSYKIPSQPTKEAIEKEKIDRPIKSEMLNEKQKEAAEFSGRTAAVIAGPGTGKTKTLIAHITFLLKNQNVLPEEITAVTFTNQAAKELKERLILSVGKELANRIQAGTFHSICMKLLKDSGKEFHLVQEAECIELAEHILNSFEHKKRVTAKQIVEQSSRKKMLLSYKNSLEDPFLLAYEKALNTENALDFDDLLLETLKCYETEEFPRDCFSYLLVDEVQDINLIQYRLLKTWNKNGKELFVIGDPDQAIYGFRGALSDCFKRIQQEMPETKTIRLTENYRSTPQILSLAECIISEKDKQKRGLHAVNQKGVSVRIVENQTSLSEGIFLAKEINRLVGGIDMLDFQTASTPNADSTSVGFSDICILYRTKRQAKQLEYCLQKEGIPYVVSGREEFLMELEVRATIDFFFSLFHPDDTLLSKNCREFLWGSSGEELYKKALEEWSNRIEEETPKQILDLWIKEREWDKKESIQKLIAMAGCYKTMQEFLTALIFGVESDLKRSGNSVYIPDAVHLMTLHGSKGLEFPVVFLCGVNQGLIPLQIGTDIDLEEERRLFYVGITRAKETLILSSHAELSEFLDPAFSDLSQSQITTEEKENTASLNFIEKEENHKKKKRDKKQEQSFGTQMNLFDFLDTGGQDAKKI